MDKEIMWSVKSYGVLFIDEAVRLCKGICMAHVYTIPQFIRPLWWCLNFRYNPVGQCFLYETECSDGGHHCHTKREIREESMLSLLENCGQPNHKHMHKAIFCCWFYYQTQCSQCFIYSYADHLRLTNIKLMQLNTISRNCFLFSA